MQQKRETVVTLPVNFFLLKCWRCSVKSCAINLCMLQTTERLLKSVYLIIFSVIKEINKTCENYDRHNEIKTIGANFKRWPFGTFGRRKLNLWKTAIIFSWKEIDLFDCEQDDKQDILQMAREKFNSPLIFFNQPFSSIFHWLALSRLASSIARNSRVCGVLLNKISFNYPQQCTKLKNEIVWIGQLD